MYAPSLRWRLFLLKYDRLSSGVGSRMENDTAPASGTRGASKLKAWRISAMATAFGLVALFFAWQWYDGHNRIGALRDELAQRVRESESDSRDARLSARQAQETAREAQAKLAQIELKLAEFQNQQLGLETLYQELSRNRDEWVMAEIEQILTIASQQLQLTGNVQVALSALQTADARLARSCRKLARRRRPLPSVRPTGYGKGWSRNCSASSGSSSGSRTWKARIRRCSARRRRSSCAR